MNENEMVECFLSKAWGDMEFVKEVPVFAKSVDLVRLDKSKKLISAIEVKTSKWRKAMAQVLGSAIVFDFLEICVLRPVTEQCRKIIIEDCKSNGVGLYFINGETKEIEHMVNPLHRSDIWGIQHERIMEYIAGRIQK
jgi:hypothetical protein